MPLGRDMDSLVPRMGIFHFDDFGCILFVSRISKD